MTEAKEIIAAQPDLLAKADGNFQLQGVFEVISEMAKNPKVNPDNVGKWLEIYERLEAQRREQAYKEALARLQADMPQMEKRGVIDLKKDGVSRGRIKYAKLEDIDTTIRPMLAREGFSFSFGSDSQDGQLFRISAELSHRDGHSQTFEVCLPIDTGPGRSKVQAIGSTLSYARRQLIKMALHIVEKGEDDDGSDVTPISSAQVEELQAFMAEVKADEKRFLKFMGVAKLEEVTVRDYGKAVAALEQKRRAGK